MTSLEAPQMARRAAVPRACHACLPSFTSPGVGPPRAHGESAPYRRSRPDVRGLDAHRFAVQEPEPAATPQRYPEFVGCQRLPGTTVSEWMIRSGSTSTGLLPTVNALHAGRVYASRHLFADTGEGLSQMYNRPLAPPGQHEQLIAAGHFQGLGWIDTRGLGEPDRIIPLRGDS